MPNDTTVQVAVVGIFTTLITTIGVIVVAIINNRKERGGAANEAVEETLRERIILRDEQILDLKDEVAHKEAIIQRLKNKIKELEDQHA
jgi:hypothetical protein